MLLYPPLHQQFLFNLSFPLPSLSLPAATQSHILTIKTLRSHTSRNQVCEDKRIGVCNADCEDQRIGACNADCNSLHCGSLYCTLLHKIVVQFVLDCSAFTKDAQDLQEESVRFHLHIHTLNYTTTTTELPLPVHLFLTYCTIGVFFDWFSPSVKKKKKHCSLSTWRVDIPHDFSSWQCFLFRGFVMYSWQNMNNKFLWIVAIYGSSFSIYYNARTCIDETV